jgi:uncharacterized membrane protein YgcG
MRPAYNETDLRNLQIIRETKRWYKHHILTKDQFTKIAAAYTSRFYSPNIMIRILLFIATLVALSGLTGILALIFLETFNAEQAIGVLMILYGVASFAMLEGVFIKKNHQYKSGLTEALLYHATGFVIGGLWIAFEGNGFAGLLLVSAIVLTLVSIRYLDLINTLLAIGTAAYFVFYELYEIGGIFQMIIPFVFIVIFTPVYFISHRQRKSTSWTPWHDNLLIVECVSLLLIYLAGNYLVVRELSVNLMNLTLEEGQDIPFAFIFYVLTVIIPVLYLYFGIKGKDIVLIRISLLLLALSVFTFKYYFSMGHPEITLTLAGAVLLGAAIALLHYLKEMRHGYTRESLLSEKWADANLEGFVISQTMGGNQTNATHTDGGGGGSFGGGGSTDSF